MLSMDRITVLEWRNAIWAWIDLTGDELSDQQAGLLRAFSQLGAHVKSDTWLSYKYLFLNLVLGPSLVSVLTNLTCL